MPPAATSFRRRVPRPASLIVPLVSLIDDTQAIESELIVDHFDLLREAADQGRQPAGGDHFDREAELFLHPRADAVDQRDVAEDEAALHRGDRVAADDAVRFSKATRGSLEA